MPRPFAILDTKKARKDLRRLSRALGQAEGRALDLAGGTVRRAYISGIRRGNSKALPDKVAPLDRRWRKILHPGRKQGGGLVQTRLWPIHRDGSHGVTVDILAPYRATLARYQDGSRRFIQLAALVRSIRARAAATVRGRLDWDAIAAGISWRDRGARRMLWQILDLFRSRGVDTGDPRAVYAASATLPAVHGIPARPVVGAVRSWAARNLSAWYLSILHKLSAGKIGAKRKAA